MEEQAKEIKNHKARLLICIIVSVCILLLLEECFIPFVRYPIYNNNEKVIACVGDSITHGYGIALKKYYSYPGQLQLRFNKKYAVKNFGLDGAAVQKNSILPYMQSQEYKDSLESNPQIVLIMLGTNDSKPYNYASKDTFKLDYIELIKSYKNIPSVEQILLLLPITAYENDFYIDNVLLQSDIRDAIYEIAEEYELETIDVRSIVDQKSYYSKDGVHLNSSGAKQIANSVFQYLTSNN